MLFPTTQDEVCEAVARLPSVRVCGGGTKTALSADATLSTASLRGILEYHPSEFTFTALAGTPLSQVRDALAAHGQYLPFDPPWTAAGATLGGTVAAGLSGPGRFQYGGVRDFLLGVRIVIGDGRLVRGGGKVVKNAAGFDIPKLMVGSLGRLGVITEVSFKVFPAPVATTTLRMDCPTLDDAVNLLDRLASSRLAFSAIDLEPPTRLWLRLGGLSNSLPQRVARVREFVGTATQSEVIEEDELIWCAATEFDWQPPDWALVKLPLTSSQIPELESILAKVTPAVLRRYSVGGNVAWLAWPPAVERRLLSEAAARLGRPLLIVRDGRDSNFVQSTPDNPLLARLRSVFDPAGKFRM